LAVVPIIYYMTERKKWETTEITMEENQKENETNDNV